MPEKQRLLVANRGEIAVRVLSTARELVLYTIAVYTDSDRSHTTHAHQAVQLPNASSFLDVNLLVSLCQKHNVNLVHPGYGFLSESADFKSKLEQAGITFIGPSADILQQTGDKLSARKLAETCGVPVLPALIKPTNKVGDVAEFAKSAGWPLMLKAVDGGGGRGIRLVNNEKELGTSFQRALNESPSKSVFAERAAIGGFRHIEVQILGDGKDVRHYWERECSIQRRYQKVVEIAPSLIEDRKLVAAVIESAIRMAKHINYKYLGTWEFLVSPGNASYYFMEINPRLQVEHTITETICGVDLVRTQILIAQGSTLQSLSVSVPAPTDPPPPSTAIQLRLTAEDPKHDFSLSIGRINSISFPGGNGVRVDTHIRPGVVVSADFDSLLAKLIASSSDWNTAVDKCSRVLDDTTVEGIMTNRELLRGIIFSDDFRNGRCDTQWLEKNLQAILSGGSKYQSGLAQDELASDSTSASATQPSASAGTSLKKGDAFNIRLDGPDLKQPFEKGLSITKVMRNDFPASLAVELAPAQAASGRSPSWEQTFTLHLSQSSAITNSVSGRQGDPKNPAHLICPLAGQLIEILVDESDIVEEFEPVAIIRQMKMELEVRAQRRGVVKSLWEVEEGDDVGSGMLVCEIILEERTTSKL